MSRRNLVKLQDQFALIDLMSKPVKAGFIGILVKELQTIQLRIEQDRNHSRPHLHISYGKERHIASYGIDNGKRIIGDLDSKYDKQVKLWIEENRATLLQIWKEVKSGNQRQYELLIAQL